VRRRERSAASDVISEHERVGHRLEGERGLGAGNLREVRVGAERDDELVVRELAHRPLGQHAHDAPTHIHIGDRRLDESRATKRGANRLRAVPELQRSRAGFEEQRREHEEIDAAHEGDLDVRPSSQPSLECARRGHTSEPASEHHDPCRRHTSSLQTPRFRVPFPIELYQSRNAYRGATLRWQTE
jgi:hypothetical protein